MSANLRQGKSLTGRSFQRGTLSSPGLTLKRATRSSRMAPLDRKHTTYYTMSQKTAPCLFLPRDAMHKRGLCRHAVSVSPCVCLSVTFVSCVKTNKHIFNFFSPSGSQAILVLPYQTAYGNILTGTLPLTGGVECRWGRQKSRF